MLIIIKNRLTEKTLQFFVKCGKLLLLVIFILKALKLQLFSGVLFYLLIIDFKRNNGIGFVFQFQISALLFSSRFFGTAGKMLLIWGTHSVPSP